MICPSHCPKTFDRCNSFHWYVAATAAFFKKEFEPHWCLSNEYVYCRCHCLATAVFKKKKSALSRADLLMVLLAIDMLQPLPLFVKEKKTGPTRACSMSVSLSIFVAQPLPQFFRKNRDRAAHVYCLYFLPLVCCSRCHIFLIKIRAEPHTYYICRCCSWQFFYCRTGLPTAGADPCIIQRAR